MNETKSESLACQNVGVRTAKIKLELTDFRKMNSKKN